MASAKHFYLFFSVFLFSSASLQIHARDSQFFSKFTRVDTVAAAANNNNTDGINNNAENVKETAEVLPKKETPVAEAPLNSNEIPASSGNKKEEKPSLSKQVEEANNGHGLYGHGSGQFPPTTTETSDNDEALDSMTYAELPDEENFSEEFGTSTDASTSDQGGAIDQSKTTKDGYPYYNNNNNVYKGKQFGLAEAQFGTGGNVDQSHYRNYNNKRNHDEQQLEKQGMSDTRFLENGKYYYHVEAANPNVNTRNDEYYKHISGAEFIDHSAVQEQNEGSHYGVADKIANNDNVYEGKQFGLSDAQFSTDNVNNNQNYEQQLEKQGMSDTRFPENGQRYDGAAVNNNNYNYNYNKYHPIERQGMSDTRFQEHGRYYKAAYSSDNINNNMYRQGERQGMSDTRFLANGKYYYHVEAANPKVDTHNDEYSKHIDGAEFIQHSAVQEQNEGSHYGTTTGSSSSPMRMDSSRFRNQEQQQRNNNGGYYNYGTNNNNNNGNSFDRQYSNSNYNNNGNSFDRQYSNSDSNSNYYSMDQEMNNKNNNFDDDNQLGPEGEYIP